MSRLSLHRNDDAHKPALHGLGRLLGLLAGVGVGVGLVLAAGCSTEPPFAEQLDVGPPLITGTLIVSGPERPANTMVLVYMADDPPPPVGTGRPITFSTVPASAFRSEEGVFEAPYSVSLPGVSEGEVLVTALMDMDDNFYPLPPWAEVLGGATCGDFSGAHVADLVSGELAPVSVRENERVDGISVLIARESTLERPSFVFQGGSPRLSREVAATGATQTFRLASTPIAAIAPRDGNPEPILEITGPFDGTEPCDTALWVTVYDRDGDGQPDPSPDFPPETGLMDAWPQVVLQYLGELDEDGVVQPTLEPGESWAMRSALFPGTAWFGEVPLNTPTPLTQAEYIFVPAAQHTLPDGSSEVVMDPTQLPAGAWSVTVINIAGQTWTVPNFLANVGSFDPDNYDPSGQAGAVILE
ncbi:MAG: hypothetical protein EA397_15180 [Deltaproteobacteria bacterium]|nr:MAG: hypothetical protein EA397_15180 [Deltaproteobacteria bacterium]